MNYKLELHKERLRRMLALIDIHERYEEIFDFDQKAVKEHEERTIMEYSAEFAALNQLAFEQIAEHKNNAKPLGTIVIDEDGKATGNPILDRLISDKEKDLIVQQTLS